MVSKTSYNLIKAFSYDESNLPQSFTKLKFKADFSKPQNNFLNGIAARLFHVEIGKEVSVYSFENNLNVKSFEFETGSKRTTLEASCFRIALT